ncbi:MAG: PIN domain-containing protein [Deltaproteobacteria bacterium]|nr:PIN domain-containing protein [Deltaproteobacteria bacterium]
MIVVDTSAWIDFFRGRSPLAEKLSLLLERDEVALPVPVRIEILSGAKRTERARLQRVLSALPVLYPTEASWRRMEDWVVAGATAGQRFGVGDLMVAALAVEHGCTLWSLDGDFGRMARLKMVALAEP